ncbi:MAG: GNAT family N-acetyltransferase [Planctomycetes bacterium]|nr:GNAT family N-acetyltransferase [Planctomycetota bacterium]
MARGSTTPRIRTAREGDLRALYELAGQALLLDSFSPELLAEKLFKNPRPAEFTWAVYLAESKGRPAGFMQSVTRPVARKAWLGLFAVDAPVRRRGIASALFQHAKANWPADTEEIEVLAIPGNYFTPGLDPRYTEALAFLERLGFERFKDCVNLTAELSERFDTSAEEQRLTAAGIEVRRARPDDDSLLDAFFAEHFGEDWRFEAGLAMLNQPPGLHLALRDGRIIAFSGHSSQNREWGFFGPMGTAPEARGLGVGRVLMWHCLNDMRDAGHRTAVIPWVGPIAFYQQWAGCRVERVFWRYRLQLQVSPDE